MFPVSVEFLQNEAFQELLSTEKSRLTDCFVPHDIEGYLKFIFSISASKDRIEIWTINEWGEKHISQQTLCGDPQSVCLVSNTTHLYYINAGDNIDSVGATRPFRSHNSVFNPLKII